MVRDNIHLVFRTFQVMPPLVQRADNRQELLVVDFVVPLRVVQGLGVECDRVQQAVTARLRENRSGCEIGCIALQNKWLRQVRHRENRGGREAGLKLVKGGLLSYPP